MDNIKESILMTCEIPPMPMVAVKIVNLVNKANVEIDALQDVIMADQSIASNILRLANSAYYGLRRNVDTISDAIVIMGLDVVKNLALAISAKTVYKRFGILEQKLWEHSIGVSIAAGIIAKEIRFPEAEKAMVAGLLHDIGKTIMNNSQPERFLMLMEKVYNERVRFSDIEKEIFGFGHAEVGNLFAEKWGFSENLCDSIKRHHFHDYDDIAELSSDRRMLCCTIAMSDTICVRLGVGYRGPMPLIASINPICKEVLMITDEQLSEIVEKFKQAYIQEKTLYQA